MAPRQARRQKVFAAPPLVYFGGLVAGVVLDTLLPIALPRPIVSLDLLGASAPLAKRIALGGALFVAGFAINLRAVLALHQAETTILPWGPPSRLVLDGPYRFSRNPMYLGLTLAYVGLAIVVGSLWALVLLPVVLVVMVYGVIRREESHLAWRFGADYEAYRARVRRWL